MTPEQRKGLANYVRQLAEDIESCAILKVNLNQEIDYVEVTELVFVRSGIESICLDILRR